METRPFVSVIIPVKNGGRFLTSAIESVLAQDYRHYEMIIVDGKSTDNTRKIAQSFQQARYLLQMDEGFGNALNAGIDIARGELIAFISSDDIWVINKLGLQVDYFMQHPEVQYTITMAKFFLEDGDAIPPGFRKEWLSRNHVGFMPETLVVRKSLFNQIGKFRSDLKISADVDWFARAKDLDIPMAVLPDVLVYKRVHNANSTLDTSQVRVINHELLKSLKHSIDRQKNAVNSQKNTNE
jgi:glycosyltransferase involved in cell wall biosynthesis